MGTMKRYLPASKTDSLPAFDAPSREDCTHDAPTAAQRASCPPADPADFAPKPPAKRGPRPTLASMRDR
jgi:hypothetical protein